MLANETAPRQAAITDFNPFDPTVTADPYAYYAWLREERPAYHNERYDIWALSRYDDVMMAARRHDLFSSAHGVGPEKHEGLSMITQDPPVHDRLRGLVHRAFTPTMLSHFGPRVQEIIDDLFDDVIAKGSFELIDDLAFPLPVIVIAELMGVEPERRDDFKRWSDDAVDQISSTAETKDMPRFRRSWDEFKQYFAEMAERRRREPREDLVSRLVQVNDGGDELTKQEILDFCQLLLVAGNETTTNLIGNMALALSRFPDEARKLRQRPELVERMVEEALRYDGPVQMTFRTTTQAVEIGDKTIPADAKVALIYGSANRDENAFPEADRFDIERKPKRQVAFGYGIHFCLGAPLARLEARLFAETALRRFAKLSVDLGQPIERIANPMIRGPKHLPMRFEAA